MSKKWTSDDGNMIMQSPRDFSVKENILMKPACFNFEHGRWLLFIISDEGLTTLHTKQNIDTTRETWMFGLMRIYLDYPSRNIIISTIYAPLKPDSLVIQFNSNMGNLLHT